VTPEFGSLAAAVLGHVVHPVAETPETYPVAGVAQSPTSAPGHAGHPALVGLAPGALGSGLMHGQPGVIVLCGGSSRRLAGRDKTRESLAGTTVMDHLLDALPSGWVVVCVGEERATTRSVGWCRESPAGGGPVAGIAAGLGYLEPLRARICVVVGGDMPFAAPAAPTLVAALDASAGLDAVLAADLDGRPQPLLAAYRCEALRAALPRAPDGARLMSILDALVTGTVTCEAQITLDVDTQESLGQARHIAGAHPSPAPPQVALVSAPTNGCQGSGR
jgi:molybdenum cofactor guanylyltransferase